MKFYDELKADMLSTQRQIVEAKKNEYANVHSKCKAAV